MKEYCLCNPMTKLLLNYTKDKPQIIIILNHLNTLKYEDRPNYKMIKNQLCELKFNEIKDIPICKLDVNIIRDLLNSKFKYCFNQHQNITEANNAVSPLTNTCDDQSEAKSPIDKPNTCGEGDTNQLSKLINNSMRSNLINRIMNNADNINGSFDNIMNQLVKKKRKREDDTIQNPNEINMSFNKVKNDNNNIINDTNILENIKNADLSDLEKNLLTYLIVKQLTTNGQKNETKSHHSDNHNSQVKESYNIFRQNRDKFNVVENNVSNNITNSYKHHHNNNNDNNGSNGNTIKFGQKNSDKEQALNNLLFNTSQSGQNNLNSFLQKMEELRLRGQFPVNLFNNNTQCSNFNINPNFMFGNIYCNPNTLKNNYDIPNGASMQRFADMIYSINTLSNQITMQNKSLMETHKQNTQLYQQLLSKYMMSHGNNPLKPDN